MEGSESLTGSFIGTLRKVKSRIRTEMGEAVQHKQEERERSKKQWLGIFDRLKVANQRK